MSTEKQQPTTGDILEAITTFADVTEKRFSTIDKRLTTIEKNVTRIEATMVTKDYLDEKMSDLRGDMTVLIRKEDRKLQTLVSILTKKELLDTKEAEQIMAMEPFSRV